jgi:predicted RNA binding protein YcfA (HicA-like mRNA interferase family)
MSKLPAITGAEVVSAFRKAGFYLDRTRGSHQILKKEGHPYHLSIPVHKGKTVGRGLLRRQIRNAGMTEEEFLTLLGK